MILILFGLETYRKLFILKQQRFPTRTRHAPLKPLTFANRSRI